MESLRNARYRQRLAEGFLREAKQDFGLQRWRAVVDNSQLAVENAAKAVLALVLPPSRVHDTGHLLSQALDDGLFHEELTQDVDALIDCAQTLGRDVHIQTDYGDEVGGRTPWELFGENDASEALELARQATGLASHIVEHRGV
jgi:HEPN domain-containing protein